MVYPGLITYSHGLLFREEEMNTSLYVLMVSMVFNIVLMLAVCWLLDKQFEIEQKLYASGWQKGWRARADADALKDQAHL